MRDIVMIDMYHWEIMEYEWNIYIYGQIEDVY